MTLSVVIPVYGYWPAERVIAAVATLAPEEILVVDSGPGVTAVPEHPAVRVIRPQQRVWPGASRNIGWRAARGDYVLFVDADVVLTASARTFVREHMARGGEDMAFGLYTPRAQGDNAITRMLVKIQRHRFGEEFYTHPYRYGQSSHVLLPRRLGKHMGYFNPWLRMHEDKEICIRAINAGVAVNVYPEFEAEHTKIFSFRRLLSDHFEKSWLAMQTMLDQPAIFGRVSHQLGLDYRVSFVMAWLMPLLLAALALGQVIPWWLAGLGAGLNFLLPAAMCHRVFRYFDFRETLAALVMWPFMGFVISLAAGLSWLAGKGRYLGRGVRWLGQIARLGGRVLWRNGMPVAVIHFMTARCNLRCGHCFYKDTLDAPDRGEQSLEQLEKTTREMGPMLWYGLGGGEPFLRDDLPEVHEVVSRNCRPLMFTVPTNGWYTERTYLKTLEILQNPASGPITLQISVDGPAEIHDGIRGRGSWQRLIRTSERLRELQSLYPQLSLGIITVVTPDNQAAYPHFIDTLVETFQPNQISINLIRGDTVDDPLPEAELVDVWRSAVGRYQWHIRQGHLQRLSYFGGRVVRAKEAVQKDLIYRVARHDEFVTPCTGGTLIYTIWEDGRVAPCEMLTDELGNVLESGEAGDFRRIVRSRHARQVRQRIRDEKCRCTYECAMTVNSLFSPDRVPGLAREIVSGYSKAG